MPKQNRSKRFLDRMILSEILRENAIKLGYANASEADKAYKRHAALELQ